MYIRLLCTSILACSLFVNVRGAQAPCLPADHAYEAWEETKHYRAAQAFLGLMEGVNQNQDTRIVKVEAFLEARGLLPSDDERSLQAQRWVMNNSY